MTVPLPSAPRTPTAPEPRPRPFHLEGLVSGLKFDQWLRLTSVDKTIDYRLKCVEHICGQGSCLRSILF